MVSTVHLEKNDQYQFWGSATFRRKIKAENRGYKVWEIEATLYEKSGNFTVYKLFKNMYWNI